MVQYNYDALLQSMHENVIELRQKLNDLDNVYHDINSLKNSASGIPKEFQDKFNAIKNLTDQYTETLNISVKTYLDGSNTIFLSNLTSFDKEIAELSSENIKLQENLLNFKGEVDRISRLDLEAGFRDLQNTLSQIFQSIQGININLTQLTITVNSISNAINSGFNQVDKTINDGNVTLIQKLELLQNDLEKLKSSNRSNLIFMVILIVISIFVLIKLFFL